MFIKNLIVLLLITLLYGCNDDSNVKLEPITNVININTSTTLNKDYTNTTFKIKGNNIDFNLNGHILTNKSDQITILVENKSTNINIHGGTIIGNGYATGIHIAACVD